MNCFKAIIADDEEALRTHLKTRLGQVWPDMEILGEARNGVEALEVIRSMKPDLAFLDIRMPGLSGMEVARKTHGVCCPVFVTAYDEYAVEAFETEAVDYLLKPVTAPRLEKTVKKIQKRLTRRGTGPSDLPAKVQRVLERLENTRPREYLQWIRVQHRESIRLIPVEEILFFNAQDKYTRLITRDGEFLIKKPIKELETELDPDNFWRIHRGTMINVAAVDKVSPSLTGKYLVKIRHSREMLTVSRNYAHLFKKM
ncbi:MAG: response regulator transcription factor [Desulfobacteraceae bacterium]|nr:response regulator transcription factor [Desulfobacteraceae bacterium]